MGTKSIDYRHVEWSASATHAGTAWLPAAVVVTLLMTVVAPFPGA